MSNPTHNALKTDLIGRTVLLPADEMVAYERHLQRFAAEFEPSGHRETELVQSIADAQWRLNRIPVLEAGIYAIGSRELADLYPEETPAVRALLIQSKTYLKYSRELKNLHMQEARLRRQYDQDRAELRKLQSDRKFDQLFEMASNFRAENRAAKSRNKAAKPAPAPPSPLARTAVPASASSQTSPGSPAKTKTGTDSRPGSRN